MTRIAVDIFDMFIGKTVVVETGGYRILGTLKAVERSYLPRHPPLFLILENQGSLQIVRGCVSVGTVRKPRNNKEEKMKTQSELEGL